MRKVRAGLDVLFGSKGSSTLNCSMVAGISCIRPLAPFDGNRAGADCRFLLDHAANQFGLHLVLLCAAPSISGVSSGSATAGQSAGRGRRHTGRSCHCAAISPFASARIRAAWRWRHAAFPWRIERFRRVSAGSRRAAAIGGGTPRRRRSSLRQGGAGEQIQRKNFTRTYRPKPRSDFSVPAQRSTSEIHSASASSRWTICIHTGALSSRLATPAATCAADQREQQPGARAQVAAAVPRW